LRAPSFTPSHTWFQHHFFLCLFLLPSLSFTTDRLQGCQIFTGTWYQNRKKWTKWAPNVPNCHKISPMSAKYSKRPQNIFTFSNQRPSKIYPNWDFWFQNKPSGNPGRLSKPLCTLLRAASRRSPRGTN
jgi:hypothetical protein